MVSSPAARAAVDDPRPLRAGFPGAADPLARHPRTHAPRRCLPHALQPDRPSRLPCDH